MNWLQEYGDTEGPLGFPMRDAEAKALDELLKQNPEAQYERAQVEQPQMATSAAREDVSWIHTEAVDRHKEMVLQSGFRDDIFRGNPIVTMNHDYSKAPIGTSAWRMKLRENGKVGVKAKTIYPARPPEWADGQVWASDHAWALVKSGLMGGKSIGFITLKAHSPTDEEVKRDPRLRDVRRIVDEWMLVEYCCCYQPVNPEAVVEAVTKAIVSPADLKALGIEVPERKVVTPPPAPVVAFTTEQEIKKAVERRLLGIDIEGMVKKSVEAGLQRATGRI